MRKKNFLLTMAAALAFVSCSQDELLENQPVLEQNAIAFDTYVGNNAQGRAVVVDDDYLKLKGFVVDAYYTGKEYFSSDETYIGNAVFMNSTKVTYDDVKGWTYSPVKYWPNNEGDKVSFFAYAPYGSTQITFNSDYNHSKLSFTVNPEAKNQVDLIYHQANGNDDLGYEKTIDMEKPTINKKIKFNFQHALSRIAFDVKAVVDDTNPDSDNLLDGNTRINIKRVALVNTDATADNLDGSFYTSGTLDLQTGDWDDKDGAQGYELTGENFYRAVEAGETSVVQLTKFNPEQRLLNDESFLMIIPQDFSEEVDETPEGFKIYIEYDVISEEVNNNGSGDNTTNDSNTITNQIYSETIHTDFESGKAYKFTLLLGMTSVKVDAEVADWGDEIDGGDYWLPDNDEDEEESNDDVDELLKTNLVYDGSSRSIVIKEASDLAEARDFINDRKIYTVNYNEQVDGEYYRVYKVNVKGVPDDDEYVNFHEATLLQVADIDLSVYDNWKPIGLTEDTRFEGWYNVDINGDHSYTISNLKITEPTGDYVGLFGYSNGIISDISMENVQIGTEDNPITASYAAAIVGHGAGGTLRNCSVASGAIYGKQVAGLVANGYNTQFDGCLNSAIVYGSGDAAGIYAGSSGGINDCKNTANVTSEKGDAAGITISTASITNARNSGTITGYKHAGGIVADQNTLDSYVVASYNTGNVTCEGGYAGGIVGSSDGVRYVACYNTAAKISGKYAGGIIGHWDINGNETALDAVMISCYSTTADIEKYDTGDNTSFAGALCGYVVVETEGEDNTVTYTTCYYSNYTGYAIGNNETTDGITEVEGTEGNTWTEAAVQMNLSISELDWEYSSEVGAAPTLISSSAE